MRDNFLLFLVNLFYRLGGSLVYLFKFCSAPKDKRPSD